MEEVMEIMKKKPNQLVDLTTPFASHFQLQHSQVVLQKEVVEIYGQ
jgi:hypothetical protein